RIDVILNEMKIHMPELYDGLLQIEQSIDTPQYEKVLNNVYGQLKSISIDYGVMEKSDKVYLTKGNFTWSDVGSWEEVYQLSEKDDDGNAIVGKAYCQNTNDSYIYSPKKFTAVVGVDNVIVINTDDALLICRRDKAQDVKNVVDYLKMKKMTDHL
ncbi:MAG: mannose-1-phosphate guanylyltransferase, partial [Clostridiales bacterium]